MRYLKTQGSPQNEEPGEGSRMEEEEIKEEDEDDMMMEEELPEPKFSRNGSMSMGYDPEHATPLEFSRACSNVYGSKFTNSNDSYTFFMGNEANLEGSYEGMAEERLKNSGGFGNGALANFLTNSDDQTLKNSSVEEISEKQIPLLLVNKAQKQETRPKLAHEEIFTQDGEYHEEYVPKIVTEGRPVCTCAKSHCLKLYCVCFRKGFVCGKECKCVECKNKIQNKEEIDLLRQTKLSRKEKTDSTQTFCNCKMSFCEKSYCPCAREGGGCSAMCKCFNCKNPHGAKKK